jgi:repressor LexA
MHISAKQKEMLAFIETYVGQNGYPPTHEEIRVGLNISTKSLVNYHLEALEHAALLSRSPNTPRGIRLRDENTTFHVPLVRGGLAEAPRPTLETDREQAVIQLTYDIVPNSQDLFALKVHGNAMIDALVDDGDIVIIQRQNRANNGDFIAVRLVEQQQTTLKRYYRENGHVRLQPANPLLEPLILKPEAIEIEGKVMAVIRQVD